MATVRIKTMWVLRVSYQTGGALLRVRTTAQPEYLI
jgi:hypothetical protein